SGALGSIECTTAAYPGSLKKIEIVGTQGTAILEESNLTTWQFEEEKEGDEEMRQLAVSSHATGGISNPMEISHTGHRSQIIDFLSAIRNDHSPFIDAEEGK